MVEALTLTRLHEEVRERYAHDEQCVVGIMMARYDLGVTKDIVSKTISIGTAILESTLMCFGLDMVHIYPQVMSL